MRNCKISSIEQDIAASTVEIVQTAMEIVKVKAKNRDLKEAEEARKLAEKEKED